LQERIIDRVGGSKPVRVNIRVIATSNRDMQQAVREGKFREDLLYRLNVVNLKIPALRERPADIMALAQFFSRKYAEANGVATRPIAESARKLLLTHQWRGNVRELENTMHRAVLLAQGGEIGEAAIRLPDGSRVDDIIAVSPSGPAALAAQAAESMNRELVGRTVADVERDLILQTLDHCLGNRTHAANILGISIRTLRNKLKQYADEGVKVPLHGEARAAY
jgi:two-component system response regulator FlrC